jgi:hypothetical protein
MPNTGDRLAVAHHEAGHLVVGRSLGREVARGVV